jgi:hypothetical protein
MQNGLGLTTLSIQVTQVMQKKLNVINFDQVIRHLYSQKSAVEMLRSRVLVLLQFVRDMEIGLIPKDHDILLQISSLCARLPAMQGQEFAMDFNTVLYN